MVYFIRVPDLEPQTLIHYNEIFKEILKSKYDITPAIDYIDTNKYSLDRITEFLPLDFERGCTIHYSDNGAVYYGYSIEHVQSSGKHVQEVFIDDDFNSLFIGRI